MRILLILSLSAVIAMAGCIGALDAPSGPKSATRSASIDVIGAPGGHQVRSVNVTWPDLSCGGQTYAETREAFLGGFKRSYIESWNSAIEAQRLGVLTAKTPAQRKRREYLSSHFIKWTKDAEDAMYNYEIKPTRGTGDQNPYASDTAEYKTYMQASCVRSAYHKGSAQGRRQAQDDVRAVIDKAPPDA